MSSDVEQVRQAANRVNTSLTEYIMSLSEEPSKAEPVSSGQALLPPPAGSINKDNSAAAERRDSNSAATKLRKTGSLDTSADMTTRAHVRTPTPVEESAPSPQPTMDLDYEAAVVVGYVAQEGTKKGTIRKIPTPGNTDLGLFRF
ncbi:hypothetical protein LTR16_007904 [Cryomyces antarcticus]|uniref:Uncharacterized protein n=1 Tax=Cryomyces antarcticus TaxID=329879 RepID=A0ABR0M3T3_9PEZI|nr:hypothetical protein LTR16_007904 [Cryomyces antarcticus]